MTSNALVEWQQAFQGLPPLGFVLRFGLPDRWIRLYSLPGGKRYPTSDDETSELLQRHNMVATAVLGLGAPVTAWVAHFGHEKPPLDLEQWKWVSEPPLWRGSEAELEALEGARFLERTLPWTPNALDDEFRFRADDRLPTLTVFSSERGSAFCPYDGGMDVFLRSPALVDSIRRLFPSWLSTHPAGL
jgi:hypothetical protein